MVTTRAVEDLNTACNAAQRPCQCLCRHKIVGVLHRMLLRTLFRKVVQPSRAVHRLMQEPTQRSLERPLVGISTLHLNQTSLREAA